MKGQLENKQIHKETDSFLNKYERSLKTCEYHVCNEDAKE